MDIQMIDARGYPLKCYLCGKPATGTRNLTVNCASSVPSDMRPVCDEHNPYIFTAWKSNQTAGKTTSN